MDATTCDWTVERLPWWANGTLDEAEAQSVRAHLAGCAACRAELAETRAALAVYGAHPAIEALVGFVAGDAEAEISRATIEAHLAHCAACREEVAMLRESRAAVESEPGETGGTVRAFVPPARGRRGVDRRSLALAASLLLFVVAAGGWLTSGRLAERRGDRLAELERRLAAAEAPAAPPAEAPAPAGPGAVAQAETLAERLARSEERIAALEEENAALSARSPGVLAGGPTIPWEIGAVAVRDGGSPEPDGEQVKELPAGARMANLFLDRVPPGTYRLTVETLDGRLVAEIEGLEPQQYGPLGSHLSVALPLAGLPDGALRLRLSTGGEEVGSLLLRPAR